MKKISVLLPVFNCEKFIEKSISSILKNTYKNFEIIIVNDGSTDSTFELIKKFKDERIIIYNKENTGLIETLNYGLVKCNSEIVMRMDGDDIIYPDKIEKQLQFLIKSNSILTGTQGFTIDSKGEKTGKINLPLKHNNIVKSLLHLSSGFIHPSVMFYKELIFKLGGYNNNFKHAEDFDLFLRLSNEGKISNMKDRLIYLRKHDSNISLLNTEEQIKNSIISRDLFLNFNYAVINKSNFKEIKERVEKNFIKKLYIKIQTIIVKFENNKSIFLSFILFFLKVFRRVLKFII